MELFVLSHVETPQLFSGCISKSPKSSSKSSALFSPGDRSCRQVSYPLQEVGLGGTLAPSLVSMSAGIIRYSRENKTTITQQQQHSNISLIFSPEKASKEEIGTWTMPSIWTVQAVFFSWVLWQCATSLSKLQDDKLVILLYCDNHTFVTLCTSVCMTCRVDSTVIFVVHNSYYIYHISRLDE